MGQRSGSLLPSLMADGKRSFTRDLLSEAVIGRAIEVHRQLGPGLLESTYEECLCMELIKAVERLAPVHEAQLLTYLKHTSIATGLLFNFNVPVLRDGMRRLSL